MSLAYLTEYAAPVLQRRLRNALVHEYMHDAQVFLDSLLEAREACEMFFSTIDQVVRELERLGVIQR